MTGLCTSSFGKTTEKLGAKRKVKLKKLNLRFDLRTRITKR